jgi:AcrR family transcriptional regulator
MLQLSLRSYQMPAVERTTYQRILLAARDLLATRGIRRVSMDDVAGAAGVTRVTVYRYFGDRQSLVRAAFLHLADSLDAVVADLGGEPHPDVEGYTARVGEVIVALPAGLQEAMADLQRAHPEVHAEVRARERQSISALFDLLYSAAEAQGRIRPGLKRPVVEVLFWEIVTSFLDDPLLQEAGLSPTEVFQTIVGILLNGILIDPSRVVARTSAPPGGSADGASPTEARRLPVSERAGSGKETHPLRRLERAAERPHPNPPPQPPP